MEGITSSAFLPCESAKIKKTQVRPHSPPQLTVTSGQGPGSCAWHPRSISLESAFQLHELQVHKGTNLESLIPPLVCLLYKLPRSGFSIALSQHMKLLTLPSHYFTPLVLSDHKALRGALASCWQTQLYFSS